MSRAEEVLEQLAHSRSDASVGPHAMRWTPEPRREPRVPRSSLGKLSARAAVVRRLVDEHGLSGDSAWSAVSAVESGQPTEHEELVAAAARRSMAEVTDLITEVFGAFARALQPVAEAAAAWMRQFDEVLRAVRDPAAGSKPGPTRDRPAWQSPYGPPSRRR